MGAVLFIVVSSLLGILIKMLPLCAYLLYLVTLTPSTPLVSHRRRDSVQSMPRKLTPSEVRSKVVEEILNTERDYVKHLEDIIEVGKGFNLIGISVLRERKT